VGPSPTFFSLPTLSNSLADAEKKLRFNVQRTKCVCGSFFCCFSLHFIVIVIISAYQPLACSSNNNNITKEDPNKTEKRDKIKIRKISVVPIKIPLFTPPFCFGMKEVEIPLLADFLVVVVADVDVVVAAAFHSAKRKSYKIVSKNVGIAFYSLPSFMSPSPFAFPHFPAVGEKCLAM